MSVPFETAVIEDLATGYGTKTVTMPAGGSAVGTKVNRGTIPAPTSRCGTVHVYPPAAYLGKGVCYAPDGTEISTAGSATSGLQEAFTYAAAHGHDIHVHGGNEGPDGAGGAVVYNVDAGVTLDMPSMQGKCITFGATTINFGGSGSETCLRFDSLMMVRVRMEGTQLACIARTGDLLRFDPRTAVPLDAVIGIVDTAVDITTVAFGPSNASGCCVRFVPNLGPITNSTFQFDEINAGDFGICVNTPATSMAFAYNKVVCHHIHDQIGTSPHVLAGASAGALNQNIRDNVWELHITGGGGTNKRGFGSHGTRDMGIIRTSGIVAASYDVFLEAEARFADFALGTDSLNIDDMVRDESTGQNNWVKAQHAPVLAAITPGASPFVYPKAADVDVIAREFDLVVQGGTVSAIEIGDNTNWVTTGQTAGTFRRRPGMFYRVTYSGTPTMNRWV